MNGRLKQGERFSKLRSATDKYKKNNKDGLSLPRKADRQVSSPGERNQPFTPMMRRNVRFILG
jgi:hypothetical protein